MPSFATCSAMSICSRSTASVSRAVKGSSRIQSVAWLSMSRASATRFFLALRQDPCGQVLAAGQAHLFQRVPDRRTFRGETVQAGGDAEVLDPRQVALDAVEVTKIERVAMEILCQTARVLPVPQDLPRVRGEQSAERAQQGRLAAAVAAAHMQEGSRFEREREPREQEAITAPALKIGDFKHERDG